MEEANGELASLRAELERLAAENEALRRQSRDVATATARAVELITDYDEERERLQLRIEQTQKLESLGLLAGGIAHDFANLLQAITSFSELALRAMPESGPSWEIEQVLSTTEHATELCDQLLSYAGKGHRKTSVFDLAETIRGIRQLLELSAEETAFELELPSEPLPVEGDAGQLRQVVLNLVSNAAQAQAGRPGGIRLRADLTHCDADLLRRTILEEELEPGDYVSVRVSDQGTGMGDGALRRIFEPFFTTKGSGRGLGLPIVLGIVRSHKGGVIVDSTPGEGTTFQVLLPRCQRAAS